MTAQKLPTSPERSALMSRIRSVNTKPELLVRRALHGLGYRFRLHVRSLPGCPDIVLPKHRTIIQVKGCFWHGHSCRDGRLPSTNVEYWTPKLLRNRERDNTNERKLRRLGWSVFCVWECKLKRCTEMELGKLLSKMLPKK
jgi:DNA mismatch endonuclease (patch repair protein)